METLGRLFIKSVTEIYLLAIGVRPMEPVLIGLALLGVAALFLQILVLLNRPHVMVAAPVSRALPGLIVIIAIVFVGLLLLHSI